MPLTPAKAVQHAAIQLNVCNAALAVAVSDEVKAELTKNRQALRVAYIDAHALYAAQAYREED